MPDDIAASAAETVPDFSAFEAAENQLSVAGEGPAAVAEPVAADPEADEQDAAETVDAAKPEPTPEKPVSKRQQQINDLIRKATESDLRSKSLEAEIAALKVKPAAEPEKKAEPAAVGDAGDPEPSEAAFEDYKSFVKAQARWEIRQAKREADAETKAAQAEQAQRSQREAFQTAAETWTQRRDAFAAKTPEFSEKAIPYLDQVHPGTPIGDVLLESEVGPEIALYLATHPEEADRIARLAPISALRALGKLEAKFDSSLTSASASAGPAAKTVTTAPAPPTTLSARSAAPADPVAAALDRGDFAAFEAEANRLALASR